MRQFPKLKGNEKVAISVLKDELSKRYNLVEFRLFGSKARGDYTHESDIDVFIELDETNYAIESQIRKIILEVNLKNDTFISATIFGKKEIEEGPMSESPIYKTIMREGISL